MNATPATPIADTTPDERAQRVRKLIAWATTGWPGYSRGVRDMLDDARHLERRGDGVGAEHFLREAERWAERCRLPMTDKVFGSVQTYEDAWIALSNSPVFHPFEWPITIYCTRSSCGATKIIDRVPDDPSTEIGCPTCGARMSGSPS